MEGKNGKEVLRVLACGIAGSLRFGINFPYFEGNGSLHDGFWNHRTRHQHPCRCHSPVNFYGLGQHQMDQIGPEGFQEGRQ